MKLGVSLPEEDVRFLDEYCRAAALDSRSATIQRAVQLLRDSWLADEYSQIYSDPSYIDEAQIWDSTVGDGLADEAR